MTFEIFMPEGVPGSPNPVNQACEHSRYQYQKVAEVEAESLDDAYRAAQPALDEAYARLNLRGASAGDIFRLKGFMGVLPGYPHIRTQHGWLKVTNAWLTFIDWGARMRMTS